MKLVAANVGGLAVAAVVLYGFAESPDSRIEHASGAVIEMCDRDPQNAGPIHQDSPSSGVEHSSAWFNVHVMTGALYGSAASQDSRAERTSGAVTDTDDCDPRNAGPARQAPSPSGAEFSPAWFNVH